MERNRMQNEKCMKDRIRQLMEDLHLTQQTFAQMIGSSTATLSNIYSGKTNPSLSIVDGIHRSFPQVNIYWILYGTPPMYQNQGGSDGGNGTESGDASLNASALGGGTDAFANGASMSNNSPQEATAKFGAQGALASSSTPSPIDLPQGYAAPRTQKDIAQATVKYVDKPQRKITEIRIFYDDQTWETFVPKK